MIDLEKSSSEGLWIQQEHDDSTNFDSQSLRGVQTLPPLSDEIKDISRFLLSESTNLLTKG
jgi:hypothetical protein